MAMIIEDKLNVKDSQDHKIVDGFIRNYLSEQNMNDDCSIPTDIINLIFIFYHIIMEDSFKYYNPDTYTLSNHDMKITRTGHISSVCYGSFEIPSTYGGIYSWTFKILNIGWNIGIGIDETKHIRKDNGGFNTRLGESKCYILYHDGDRRKWDCDEVISRDDKQQEWANNDIVEMALDLQHRTLSYKLNDGQEQVQFEDLVIGQDINYCMAAFLEEDFGRWQDSIELIGCVKL